MKTGAKSIMKRTTALLAAVCFGFPLAYAADYRASNEAERRAVQQPHRNQQFPTQQREAFPASLGTVKRAGDLIGSTVENPQGQTLGRIDDLVVDLNAGRLTYAVMSSGGILGVGGKLFAVPPRAFSVSRQDKETLVLNVDRQRLARAPGFDRENWPDMGNPQWAEDTYRFHNQPPYWLPSRHGISIHDPSGSPRQRDLPYQDRQTLRTAEGMVDERLHIQRVSDLKGTTVRNPQNENLGEIQDVVVDLEAGRILYVVLGTGGFLGLGQNYYAIPPETVRMSGRQNQVLVNVDRQRLAQAPGFDRADWPGVEDQEWAERVYRFHGQQPYWQSDSRAETQTPQRRGVEPFQQQTRRGIYEQEYRPQTEQFERDQPWNQGQAYRTEPRTQRQQDNREYDRTRNEQRDRGILRDDRLGRIARASDLRGTQVVNHRDRQLGDIRDVVVDLASGRVVYLVLGGGGFLGLGERYFAIPPQAFQISQQDDWELLLPIAEQQLSQGPGFDRDNWPIMANPRWAEQSYRFHRQQPHWQAGGQAVRDPSGAPRSQQPQRGSDQQWDRDQRFRDSGGTQQRVQRGRGILRDEGIGRIARFSDLKGTTVRNHQKEVLGDIRDIVVDIQSGEVLYVALGTGGMLGLGERYFAIPPEAFQVSADDDRELLLAIEAGRITQAQGFDRNNWPAEADDSWADQARLHSTPQQRREDQRPPPRGLREPAGAQWNQQPQLNQSEVENDAGRGNGERGITQQIRRALVTDETLSTSAKNVNIHVARGTVTLKGQVNSEQEKQAVESTAREIAGRRQVQSQIEVRDRRSR
jgi:sporulation protein YlmC with PRC-barrel domain